MYPVLPGILVANCDCAEIRSWTEAVVAHLEIKVGLLKTGAGHGLGAGLLTLGPDLRAVGSLLHDGGRFSRRNFDSLLSILLGRRDGRRRIQLTAGSGKRARALARQLLGCPQSGRVHGGCSVEEVVDGDGSVSSQSLRAPAESWARYV